MSDHTSAIVTAIVSGLFSGVGVAVLTHLLSRKKTEAEIQKIRAESQKILAETAKITSEVQNLSVAVNNLAGGPEVLFDGSKDIDGFDVKGRESYVWDSQGKPISSKGLGELKFEPGGILNLQRLNTDGRFELLFQRYRYKGAEHANIPKDDVISGKRNLRVNCEAKAVGGSHVLIFVVKNSQEARLAYDTIKVNSNEWVRFPIFLPVDPSQDCTFRIYDQEVSHAPSSVQIRSLVLTQQNQRT